MALLSLIFIVLVTTCILSNAYHNIQWVRAENNADCRLWRYDSDNIPYFKYTEYPEGKSNPSHVAGEVLFNYKDSVEGNTTALEKLINNADWLVEHAVSHGNYSILNYDFPFSYGMDPPWRSNLAQAKALDALAKAYQVTNNRTYLDAAGSLLNSFFVEVKDGGVALKSARDGWWFEQHANNDVKNASRVLNGMISSLLDIHAYYEYTNDMSAKFLFDKGILALKKTLPLYDDNGWSYYDIHKKPAKPTYHLMHIRLLDALSNITGEKIFERFRDRWEGFMTASNTTPLEVKDTNVSNALVNPNLSAVVVEFNKPVDRSSINASTVMLMKSSINEFCTRSDRIDGRIGVSPDDRNVIFRPSETLVPNASYTFIVSHAVADLAGNTVIPHATVFHTEPRFKK